MEKLLRERKEKTQISLIPTKSTTAAAQHSTAQQIINDTDSDYNDFERRRRLRPQRTNSNASTHQAKRLTYPANPILTTAAPANAAAAATAAMYKRLFLCFVRCFDVAQYNRCSNVSALTTHARHLRSTRYVKLCTKHIVSACRTLCHFPEIIFVLQVHKIQ